MIDDGLEAREDLAKIKASLETSLAARFPAYPVQRARSYPALAVRTAGGRGPP